MNECRVRDLESTSRAQQATWLRASKMESVSRLHFCERRSRRDDLL